MSKGILASALTAIVLGAIVAGCGGGDDSSSSGGDETAAALSKAEFIKQADAICLKGNESIASEAEDFAEENDVDTEDPTEAQQEEVVSEVVGPGVRQQAEEINELAAPSGDEAEIEAMVKAVESGAEELEEEPKALLEGENPLGEASKLARAYGLKECGEE